MENPDIPQMIDIMDESTDDPYDASIDVLLDDIEPRAEPAVIAPNPVDYVNMNIERTGSGDDPRLNKDNDDEDIQSPAEDLEDLTQSFEVPIHNQLIVPLVSSLGDNNTSTQSDLISTESAASATSPSLSSAVPMKSIQQATPTSPTPTVKTTSSLTTSSMSPTILSAIKLTSAPTTTSTSTSTTSALFTFEALYSEDDETEMNWSSSDYAESEKLFNVLKIHKIQNMPITDEPITLDPMLKQAGLNTKYNYQELIGGLEKRQLFVYNHDQCISYKDGSKSSSHIIYSERPTVSLTVYISCAISEKSFRP